MNKKNSKENIKENFSSSFVSSPFFIVFIIFAVIFAAPIIFCLVLVIFAGIVWLFKHLYELIINKKN